MKQVNKKTLKELKNFSLKTSLKYVPNQQTKSYWL